MPLPFQPKPRTVLICDFSGYIQPEIVKRRPVVVIKAHKTNSRLVVVVPLSTSRPIPMEEHHYLLLRNPLPNSVATEVWAKCDLIAVVSTVRLDMVRSGKRRADGKREYLRIQIGPDQLDAIRRRVVAALGLTSVMSGCHPVARTIMRDLQNSEG
jgi:uncharacterized protein YifN (PemK superfamily)